MRSVKTKLLSNIILTILLVLAISIKIKAGTVSVLFTIDMKYQITQGIFNTASNKVYLRGSFNNWDLSGQMAHQGNGVYTITLNMESASYNEFKFYTDAPGFPNSGYEKNVGISRDDRCIIPGTHNIELAHLYFNNANMILRKSTTYYDFYSADSDVQYVDDITGHLDRNIPRIMNTIEATQGNKVNIWLFPDRKSFMLSYRYPDGPDWLVGYASNASDIAFITPSIEGSTRGSKSLICHEFTHIVVAWKNKSGMTTWLTEGAACYLSDEMTALAIRTDGQVKYSINHDLGGVKPALSYFEDSNFADRNGYGFSTCVADFILSTHGASGLAKFIERVDYSVLGYSSKQAFESAWYKFIDDVYMAPQLTVQFQVDMSYYINKGWFNPAIDKVYLEGPFNSWFPYVMSTNDNAIYNFSFPAQYNKEYQYKYKITSDGAANQGFEINTRTLQTANKNIILPLKPFNDMDESLTLLTPNGGESFIAGDSTYIRWKYTSVPNIRIEYSTDNGLSWMEIKSSTPSSAIAYGWQIPGTLTANAKVRIVDATNSLNFSASGNTFKIVNTNMAGGPYLSDDNTIALLHFENSLENKSKSTGSATGTIGNITYHTNTTTSLGKAVKSTTPITIAHSSSLNLPGDWTIEMWVKFNSYNSNGQTLITKPGDNDIYFSNYTLELNPWWGNIFHGFYFDQANNRLGVSGFTPALNKWYHVAFIRDTQKQEIRLIVHDENRNQVSFIKQNYTGSTVLTSSKDIVIGTGLDGYIDELRVSNVVRNFNNAVITAPLGGEIWSAASVRSIQWDSFINDKLKLMYSTNNGSNWITIADDIDASLKKYDWTVPNTLSNNCLVALQLKSTSEIIKSAAVFTISQAVGIESKEIPLTYKLYQNYPNPFNPTTIIKFSLAKNSFTKLVIYDALGKEIQTLINGELSAGYHEIEFNARNLSSGTYFYRISSPEFNSIKKLLLIK